MTVMTDECHGSIAQIVAEAVFDNFPEILVVAIDFLSDYFPNHPERAAYEAKLKKLSTGFHLPTLTGLDIVKKFGSKQEREFASKLVRKYHKLIKSKLKIVAEADIYNQWRKKAMNVV